MTANETGAGGRFNSNRKIGRITAISLSLSDIYEWVKSNISGIWIQDNWESLSSNWGISFRLTMMRKIKWIGECCNSKDVEYSNPWLYNANRTIFNTIILHQRDTNGNMHFPIQNQLINRFVDWNVRLKSAKILKLSIEWKIMWNLINIENMHKNVLQKCMSNIGNCIARNNRKISLGI